MINGGEDVADTLNQVALSPKKETPVSVGFVLDTLENAIEKESDLKLVQMVQKDRSLDAFGELYRRYYDSSVNFATKLSNYQIAPDIAQDAWANAYNALIKGKFKGKSKFKSWLFQITRNKSIDYLRSQKRRQLPQIILYHFKRDSNPNNILGYSRRDGARVFHESPTKDIERRDELAVQKSILAPERDRMPAQQQQVMELYFQGSRYQTIVNELDMSLGSVKCSIHRAVRKLKAYVIRNHRTMMIPELQ